MNKEIKEILRNLEYTAKKHTIQLLENGGMIEHCPQAIATEMRLNTYSANILLDYITNLEQELETINKLNQQNLKYKQYYKSRIDKAIEYIKNVSRETLNNGRVFYNELPAQNLLNILTGGDEE